jgi:hypothetical protein
MFSFWVILLGYIAWLYWWVILLLRLDGSLHNRLGDLASGTASSNALLGEPVLLSQGLNLGSAPYSLDHKPELLLDILKSDGLVSILALLAALLLVLEAVLRQIVLGGKILGVRASEHARHLRLGFLTHRLTDIVNGDLVSGVLDLGNVETLGQVASLGRAEDIDLLHLGAKLVDLVLGHLELLSNGRDHLASVLLGDGGRHLGSLVAWIA